MVRPMQVLRHAVVSMRDGLRWVFSTPEDPRPLQEAQSRLLVYTSAVPEVSIVRAIIACPAPWKVVILGRDGLSWLSQPVALSEL